VDINIAWLDVVKISIAKRFFLALKQRSTLGAAASLTALPH
jgi:hypothetical protein